MNSSLSHGTLTKIDILKYSFRKCRRFGTLSDISKWEDIPKEIVGENLESWIDYRYKCLDKQNNTVSEPYNRIQIPKNFIKSGTLVEFEPNTESCFMKVSNEACLSASKPEMECHWCLTANLCSNGRDTHSKAWMINNCSKNVSNY
ncbi:hypothetical protein Smp_154460 [Schistosoma mansoni]|uniref:hypothetical protein n=1 Tax=Schistosoma mansoni TaxID=6183 RepID=UPI00022C86C8|nr:hypothetical protein Smp_154460 [Schistosoma mansoni]|eukprot:XP_018645469.1 hypothetical protein Smp_154460 [Schistosoma mansoni]